MVQQQAVLAKVKEERDDAQDLVSPMALQNDFLPSKIDELQKLVVVHNREERISRGAAIVKQT